MAKALKVNDNTAQVQERWSQQHSGDKPNQQKLQGKSFRVNENNVEAQEPARSIAPPQQKLQGKSFQVNENSVEDQEPARSPAPPRR